MPTTVINTTINHGITFGVTYVSPLTITSTGAINNHGSGAAIFGGTGTVVNDGHITATSRTTVSLGITTISAYSGVYLSDAGAFLNNSGTITGSLYAGQLTSGGSITNSGVMYGGKWGIESRDLISITNTGTISGGSQGIVLSGGGFINNSNLISGADGIGIGGAAGTVDNSGIILSYGAGVAINAGGAVSNTGAGLISVTGSYGAVYMTGGAGYVSNAGTLQGYFGAQFVGTYNNTLVDSGTIIGKSGIAVAFGSGNDLLRLNPSASLVISGVVDGGGGTNRLEFASSASAGTLSGLGLDFVNFSIGTVDAGASWVLTDSNTIVAGFTLTDSGTLTNTGTLTNDGTLAGNGEIVDAGRLINNASIADTLTLAAGGVLSNTATGTVTAPGGTAVYGASGGAATILNAGIISASGGNGIRLQAGGIVTNQGGGTISGYNGITSSGGATVVNAGTIIGSHYAVNFAAGLANRLVVDPNSVLTGGAYGGGGVLELASASSAGTLYGLGVSITNFGSLQFDTGARWTVAGNDSANGLGTLGISGFTIGDTIDLTGFAAVSETFANNALVLTDAGNDQATLSITGNFSSGSFQLSSDNNGGTNLVVCFAAGTRIGTPAGEVLVQNLAIGDLVLTAHNGPRRIKWIGEGRVLATRGRRTAATPVIVRKDALADNVPNRDLHVTKAHSLYIDNVLIPVEFLVNHRTILWDDRAQEVEIYHVELDSHDVLLANGAPAESFRDDGNRWLFQNARSGWDLPPQAPYAPVLTGGSVVDAAWRRLLDRAGPRDLPALTDDPDLHLLIDGTRVNPEYRRGSLYGFRLPNSPRSVAVVSRSGVPSELGTARDPRALGVALRQMEVRQSWRLMQLDAADERLTTGFHAYEAECDLRWTDGCAYLPAEAFARFGKGAEVMLHLGGATQYRDDRANAGRAAAYTSGPSG